ncbi:hypothetical protein KBA73_04640 [Patescibacteria group bacterium]|nr:hypothetical protein [Patescibacteria group bacterium]
MNTPKDLNSLLIVPPRRSNPILIYSIIGLSLAITSGYILMRGGAQAQRQRLEQERAYVQNPCDRCRCVPIQNN